MNDFTIDGRNFYTFLDSISRNQEVANFRFQGHGMSMTPFIRSGDTLTIKIINKDDTINTGDIVAVKQNNKKRIFIHRVIKSKNECHYIKGDNKMLPDGWFQKKSIIGIVIEIRRESGKKIDFKPWQNFMIALFSKTRLLNYLILPTGRWVKHRILKNKKKCQ